MDRIYKADSAIRQLDSLGGLQRREVARKQQTGGENVIKRPPLIDEAVVYFVMKNRSFDSC